MRIRCVTVLAVLLLASATSGAGQVVPGVDPTDWDRMRREYRVEVLHEYNDLMNGWRQAWSGEDSRSAAGFYSEDAFLLFLDDQPARGRESIERGLREDLVDLVEIRTGLTDFLTSSRLAYALGPFWYQYRDASQSTHTVSGTFVAVLVREGGDWKIRSHVFTRSPSPSPTDN